MSERTWLSVIVDRDKNPDICLAAESSAAPTIYFEGVTRWARSVRQLDFFSIQLKDALEVHAELRKAEVPYFYAQGSVESFPALKGVFIPGETSSQQAVDDESCYPLLPVGDEDLGVALSTFVHQAYSERLLLQYLAPQDHVDLPLAIQPDSALGPLVMRCGDLIREGMESAIAVGEDAKKFYLSERHYSHLLDNVQVLHTKWLNRVRAGAPAIKVEPGWKGEEPQTIEELYNALKDGTIDLTDSLPTFGGEEPEDTNEVWSWDKCYLLVGTCVGDLSITRRPEAPNFDQD